jgi:uncharacterized protein (DUF2225 family)
MSNTPPAKGTCGHARPVPEIPTHFRCTCLICRCPVCNEDRRRERAEKHAAKLALAAQVDIALLGKLLVMSGISDTFLKTCCCPTCVLLQQLKETKNAQNR